MMMSWNWSVLISPINISNRFVSSLVGVRPSVKGGCLVVPNLLVSYLLLESYYSCNEIVFPNS